MNFFLPFTLHNEIIEHFKDQICFNTHVNYKIMNLNEQMKIVDLKF